MNLDKTELIRFKQNASTLNGKTLKIICQFIYLGRNVTPTKRDVVNERMSKAWVDIDRL